MPALKPTTFGSHRLGVSSKHTDIDLLVFAPEFADRDRHFFGTLVEEVRRAIELQDLHLIQQAFVPIIKLRASDVQVDMLLVRLIDSSLSSEDLVQADLAQLCADRESVIGLNGYRVSVSIEGLVPDVARYKQLLRSVKLWARR